MDSLVDCGLADPGMSMNHGSREFSASAVTGKCKISCGTASKYEDSSKDRWQVSGVVGPSVAVRSGRGGGIAIILE